MLGGYQFPLASNLFFSDRKDASPQNTGTLYAVDLLGACIGAVVLSACLVPLFGFLKAALLILVLNLATALLTFMAVSREKMLPV
jgi:predicted membrane-bound spermidine synthase